MKRLAIVLTAALVLFCGACGGETKPVAKVPEGIDYLFSESEGFANSAPAIKDAGGKRYVFYTTNEEANKEGGVIAARVGEQSGETWEFGEQSVLLRPESNRWDGTRVMNADVVEGKFSYQNQEYSKLMVYQANAVAAEKRFQIGLAVSNEWTSGWVRVGDKPFLAYDYEGYGDTFGVGNPSIFSVDGEGKILLFYSYGSATVTCTRFVEADLSDLAAPVLSGYITVAGEGLPLDGNPVAMVANADFKYDADTQTVYMVKDGYPYAGNAPQTATKVEVAKVAVADLYRAECRWTRVVSAIDGLDLEGWARVHSACLVSDAQGRISDPDALEIGFTSNIAAKDENDKKYEFYSGLHTYKIPAQNRED